MKGSAAPGCAGPCAPGPPRTLGGHSRTWTGLLSSDQLLPAEGPAGLSWLRSPGLAVSMEASPGVGPAARLSAVAPWPQLPREPSVWLLGVAGFVHQPETSTLHPDEAVRARQQGPW